jgi:hypothetical protein
VENLHYAQQMICALSITGYANAPFQAFHLIHLFLVDKMWYKKRFRNILGNIRATQNLHPAFEFFSWIAANSCQKYSATYFAVCRFFSKFHWEAIAYRKRIIRTQIQTQIPNIDWLRLGSEAFASYIFQPLRVTQIPTVHLHSGTKDCKICSKAMDVSRGAWNDWFEMLPFWLIK